MDITTEEATFRCLNELYCIEKQCFDKEAFSKQQIANLLEAYNSVSLTARVNNEMAGFIIGRIEAEHDSLVGHILTIDISPKHHRKGVAQKLLDTIEEIFKEKGIKESYLEVREDNIAAINLYLKAGYQKVAKLEYYYSTIHGLYLKKKLIRHG